MSLELPFGIKPVNPVAVDYYSGPWSGASTQEAINAANSGIPSAVRFTGLTANLVIAGEAKKYWYASGITDSHLVNFGETLDLATTGNPSGIAFFRADGVITDSTGLTYDSGNYLLNLSGSDPTLELRDSANNDILFQAKDIFSGTGGAFTGGRLLFYYNGVLQAYMQANSVGGMDFPFRLRVSRTGGTTPLLDVNQDGVLVESELPARTTLIAKGAAAQSANLTEWQDSSNTVLAYVDPNGNAGFKNLNVDNMTVSGTFTYVNSENVTISDKQLELASNSGTAISGDPYVDQGGIVLKSTDGDKKWIWVDATNSWSSNQSVSVTGNVVSTSSFQTSQGGFVNTDFINSVRSNFTGARIHLGNSIGGNNKIWLSTLQNPTLVATPSGVGLGTSTPGTALDIRANGSGIRLYKSYQDSSNYERLDLDYDHSRSYWVMQPEYQGSGTYQGLLLQSSIPGRAYLKITSAGNLGLGYGYGHTGITNYISVGLGYIQIGYNMWPNNLKADLLDLGLSSNRWKNVYSNLLDLQSIYPSEVTSTIQGASAQSANLTEWQDNAGNVLASVSADGSIATSGDIYPYTFNQNIGIHNTNVWENIYGKHLHALDITLSGVAPGYWKINQAGGSLYFDYNGNHKLRWRQGESFCLEGDDSFAIGNSTNVADVHLYRDAAGTWGQRDGYNSQQYNLYNWQSDSSNYQRLELGHDGQFAFMNTASDGSGVLQRVQVRYGGDVRYQGDSFGSYLFQANGHYLGFGNNAFFPNNHNLISLGRNGNRWSDIYGYDLNIEASAATGIAAIIKGAVSQSANLTEWQNSAGDVLSYTDNSGVFYRNIRSSGTDTEQVWYGKPFSSNVVQAVWRDFTDGTEYAGTGNLRFGMWSNSARTSSTWYQVNRTSHRFEITNGLRALLTAAQFDINTHITPYTRNTWDVGTAVDRWRTVYTHNLNVSGILYASGDPGTNGQVLTSTAAGIEWRDANTLAGLSGTPSGVAFFGADGLLKDSTNLRFEETNGKLGIGLVSNNISNNLTVYDSNQNYPLRVGNNTSNTDGSWTGMTFFNSTNTLGGSTQEGQASIRSYRYTGRGGLTAELEFLVQGTSVMRIDTEGHTGLGTITPDAKLHTVSTNATDVGIIAQGAAAQSANLTEWQNSAGENLAIVDSGGNIATSGDITVGFGGNTPEGSVLFPLTDGTFSRIHGTSQGIRVQGYTGVSNMDFDRYFNYTYKTIRPSYSTMPALGINNQGFGDAYIQRLKLQKSQFANATHLAQNMMEVQNASGYLSMIIDTSGDMHLSSGNSLYFNNYYGDENNYERLEVKWENHIATIQTAAAGSGVRRNIHIEGEDSVNLRNSAGALLYCGGSSRITVYKDLVPHNNGSTDLGFSNRRWDSIWGEHLNVQTDTATNVVSTFAGAVSQSANLTEWQDSAGNILTEINESGHLHIYGSGEPSDRLIIRGELDTAPTAFIRNDGFANGIKIGTDRVNMWIRTGADAFVLEGAHNTICNLQANSADCVFYRDVYTSTNQRENNLGREAFVNRWSNVYAVSGSFVGDLNVEGSVSGARGFFQSSTTTDSALTITSAALQTANLTEWQASDGTVVAMVEPDGSISSSGDISASGSLRSSRFMASDDGVLTAPAFSFDSQTNMGIYRSAIYQLNITCGVNYGINLSPQTLSVTSGTAFGWRNGNSLSGGHSFSTQLHQESNGVIGQYSEYILEHYTPQQYNIYNYWGGNTSNWERLETKWDNHVATIQTAAAGSGVVRSLAINGDTVELQNSGGTKFQVGTDNKSYVNLRPSSNGSFELGSRFLRWKNIFANGAYHGVISISADTTLAENNNAVLCDASSGTITVTLPASANYSGIRYHIKKTDSSSNVITISPDGSETIDGQSSYVVNNQYESITLVCDGSNWFII